MRCQAEEPFRQAGQSLRREFGAACEPGGSHIERKALFEFFEGTGDVLGNLVSWTCTRMSRENPIKPTMMPPVSRIGSFVVKESKP